MVVMVKAFLLLCSIPLLMTSAQDTVRCPVNYIVSCGDVLSQVSVLHSSPEHFAEGLVGFRFVWCGLASSSINNHFNLTFSEPVLIGRIRTSGFRSTAGSSFVSRFSLLFHDNKTTDLQQYGGQFTVNTSQPVVFPINHLTATMLQVVIHDAVADGGQYCWHLDVFGCRAREAVPVQTITGGCPMASSVSPASSVLPTLIHSPSSLSPSMSSCLCPPNAFTGMSVASVAAPLAVMLVVGLLLAAVIIVLIVVIWRKHKSHSSELEPTESAEQLSRAQTQTELELDNTDLYSARSVDDTEDHCRKDALTYEAVMDPDGPC